MMASQAKLDLQELEERHEELLKLEKSLVELKDLFSHVALLVNQQVGGGAYEGFVVFFRGSLGVFGGFT